MHECITKNEASVGEAELWNYTAIVLQVLVTANE